MCLYRVYGDIEKTKVKWGNWWGAHKKTKHWVEQKFKTGFNKSNLRSRELVLITAQGTEPTQVSSVTERIQISCAWRIGTSCNPTSHIIMTTRLWIDPVLCLLYYWWKNENGKNVPTDMLTAKTYLYDSFLMKGVIVNPNSCPESSIVWSANKESTSIYKYHNSATAKPIFAYTS